MSDSVSAEHWIGVSQALPEPYQRVLIFSPQWGGFESDRVRMAEYHPDDRAFVATDNGGWDTCRDATHWMPLPKLPMTGN